MTRTENREALMKWLYECDMKEELDQLEAIPFAEQLKRKPEQKYAKALTRDFLEHRAEIDSLIESSATHWRIERIGKVELAILRLAATELLYMRDIPVPIVVTQALELAKTYASEESAGFINGILGNIADGRK